MIDVFTCSDPLCEDGCVCLEIRFKVLLGDPGSQDHDPMGVSQLLERLLIELRTLSLELVIDDVRVVILDACPEYLSLHLVFREVKDPRFFSIDPNDAALVDSAFHGSS
jgi:hypothetical protein